MRTVNFTCGHCGNLMAVTLDLLGQHVRCPHCQQVVLAPASPTPTVSISASPPDPAQPQATPDALSSVAAHEEDIFAPKPVHEDLFADNKPATLEIPLEPSFPATSAAAPEPPVLGPVGDSPSPDPLAFGSPAHHASDGVAASFPAADAVAHHDPAADLVPEAPPALEERSVGRRAKAGSNAAAIVLIFLIPYALLMTGVAIYYYWNAAQQHHPLEFLPDWPGEHPGASHKGQDKVSQVYERVIPETPLPARLRIGLHKTLRVGNLEVTAEKVERKKVMFRYDPPVHDPALSEGEALVLKLHLKNLSRDEVFYPTDLGFEARWTPGQPKPYMFLEMGAMKFFGGAIAWTPTLSKSNSRGSAREYIEGQDFDNQPLQPGAQRDTVVSTDPTNPDVLKTLAKSQGPFLWRVRLRRGLERYQDREVCVSAVVGVEFTARDIIQYGRN
jgi:hypothetical protein